MRNAASRNGLPKPRGGVVIAAKVNAGNDRSGNPRRGWIIYHASVSGDYTTTIGFVDEGYEGRSALIDQAPDAIQIGAPTFEIPVREYQKLVKMGPPVYSFQNPHEASRANPADRDSFGLVAGAGAGDSVAAQELVLYAENDYDLWMRRRPEFLKNVARKMKKGRFDPELAVKLWEYFAIEAAKSYAKGYGTPYHQMFDKSTRRMAAAAFAADAVDTIEEEGGPEAYLAQKNPLTDEEHGRGAAQSEIAEKAAARRVGYARRGKRKDNGFSPPPEFAPYWFSDDRYFEGAKDAHRAAIRGEVWPDEKEANTVTELGLSYERLFWDQENPPPKPDGKWHRISKTEWGTRWGIHTLAGYAVVYPWSPRKMMADPAGGGPEHVQHWERRFGGAIPKGTKYILGAVPNDHSQPAATSAHETLDAAKKAGLKALGAANPGAKKNKPTGSLLPLASSKKKWSAAAAKKRVLRLCKLKDGTLSEATLAKAFAHVPPKEDRQKISAYKLPIADVISGRLVAVPKGIKAAHASLNGSRGGVKMTPAQKGKARRTVNAYIAKVERANGIKK